MPEQRLECPACGNSETSEEFSVPYAEDYFRELRDRFPVIADQSYILRRCQTCELRFQQTILTGEEDADLNEEYWGEEADPKPTELRELAHMAEEILIIRQLFPDVKPCVLDYGVGKANWAGVATGFQCEAWGTDTATLCEEYCKMRGVTWTPLDKIPKNRFHFINSDSVFEHIPSPLQTLRQLYDALVPGGILKLNLPGKKDFRQTLGTVRAGRRSAKDLDAFFLHIEPLIHINLFQSDNIVFMGKQAGLEHFRVPLGLSYSSMILFNTGRQLNRNLYQPWKRWRSRGTWQFFRKPAT
ncbi:MAG: methyltransferase domain-containing protein [Limisphaerales bacterium]